MKWKYGEGPDGEDTAALFSDDEVYRYELIWRWSEAPLLVAWMLNPSTADHRALDNTIKGLRTRAKAWGKGGVRVINLFAVRTKSPKVMKEHPAPVGPNNDEVIRRVLRECKDAKVPVLAGWGNHGLHLGRQDEAIAIAKEIGIDLDKLVETGEKCPGHPLYIAHATEPTLWKAAKPAGEGGDG